MRARTLMLPLLGALALAGVALPAYAAPAGTAAPSVRAAAAPGAVTHAVAGDAASRAKAARAFWTPARMKAARQAPVSASVACGDGCVDAARSLPNTTTGPTILARPAAAKGLRTRAVRPDAALATTPTQGKVFFVDPNDPGNYDECSASSINSPAGDMVMTAAHCVYDKGWMTDWIYVPAYYNGPTGYGTWIAHYMTVPPEWISSGATNDDFDYAIVNVDPAGTGASLVGTAGANGLGYDYPWVVSVVTWGYPSTYDDGAIPVYCEDSTFQDRTQVGEPCPMGEGASGGPWLAGYSTGTGNGYEVGLTSTVSVPTAGYSYSPYFGGDVDQLYNRTVSL